jgi:hypothetical protein
MHMYGVHRCRVRSHEQAGPDRASDEVFQAIMAVLQSSFVFKGIRTAVLTQVVERMKRETFTSGQVIVQQGDQASASDKLYFVHVRRPLAAHTCRCDSMDQPTVHAMWSHQFDCS